MHNFRHGSNTSAMTTIKNIKMVLWNHFKNIQCSLMGINQSIKCLYIAKNNKVCLICVLNIHKVFYYGPQTGPISCQASWANAQKQYIVSVIWWEEEYMLKYILSMREIPRAEPKEFPKGSGVYFTLYPDISHNTDILNF